MENYRNVFWVFISKKENMEKENGTDYVNVYRQEGAKTNDLSIFNELKKNDRFVCAHYDKTEENIEIYGVCDISVSSELHDDKGYKFEVNWILDLNENPLLIDSILSEEDIYSVANGKKHFFEFDYDDIEIRRNFNKYGIPLQCIRNNYEKATKINEIVGDAIEKNRQVIFTGAPGTGKTFSVRDYVMKAIKLQDIGDKKVEDYYRFVQFHPSYDYSDFVEGIRPAEIEGKDGNSFVRMDGVFKEFCRYIVNENKDEKNKRKKYYFIVDEINRADLSKVFGELMFCLEEDYRGKPIKTQYNNLTTYLIEDGKAKSIYKEDCFKEGFFIPENLVLIGTMNDIDRSVESFDFALRRRFRWINIKANEIISSSLGEMLYGKVNDFSIINNLADRICAMNEIISEKKYGLSEDYHIGPAYFKDYNDKTSLKEIFDQKIEPILTEYIRGRKKDVVDALIQDCREKLLGK